MTTPENEQWLSILDWILTKGKNNFTRQFFFWGKPLDGG